jgi:hypothetical protein
MSQKRAIALGIFLAFVIGVIAGYSHLPKRYSFAEHLVRTCVFWNDKEAFFFLDTSTTGRSSNFVLDKLGTSRYAYWSLFLGGGGQSYERESIVYRLVPSGELKRLPLPPESTTYGNWALQDGKLQVAPFVTEFDKHNGFRWDGEKFVSVPPERKPLTQNDGDSKLDADDVTDEQDGETSFLTLSARKTFKAAGWHYKQLTGYESKGTQATLPMKIGEASFDLRITTFPPPAPGTTGFDMVAFGTKSLELFQSGQSQADQVLWSQKGWQPVSKSEFERRAQHSGRPARAPIGALAWLVFFLLITFWRFGSWGHLLLSLVSMKRRVLNNMATSFSFPPATPAQFPLLDMVALDRYTQDFEGMGFVRLLDFSLVSNAPNPVPSFCRLFVHTRNHCFGEVSQLFPRGKKPMPLKCSIQSCLESGWTLAFSDRKPQAAGSLIRRRKALSVCMPAAATSELLQSFLQMRDQVCHDLGISPMRDDTLEAYIAKVQVSATEMREAVKQKNFAAGVSHVYYRKFAMLKTREEYTWLGDYPKEAERRKQGFPSEARAT